MFKRLKTLWKLSGLDIADIEDVEIKNRIRMLFKKNQMAKIVDPTDPFENIQL